MKPTQRSSLQGGDIMGRIDRRRLLQLSSAGAVAASTGSLATILAARRAPAYAQGTALHWLRWADFVPASDQLLRNQIAAECQKALGIKLTLEMINANDIQARVTSAVQSGSGPEIILVGNNWPQLYSESVAFVQLLPSWHDLVPKQPQRLVCLAAGNEDV